MQVIASNWVFFMSTSTSTSIFDFIKTSTSPIPWKKVIKYKYQVPITCTRPSPVIAKYTKIESVMAFNEPSPIKSTNEWSRCMHFWLQPLPVFQYSNMAENENADISLLLMQRCKFVDQ